MLSDRAERFLATLERRPALPTALVERVIGEQGVPCFAPWLEFHERYAGYVEPIGLEIAVWGLAHERPRDPWLPRNPEIEKELNEEIWYIRCADVHPSYDYQLDPLGEFLGRPAESFEVHIESLAVGWDFARQLEGRYRWLLGEDLRALELGRAIERVRRCPISEASDRYQRWYMSDELLIVEAADTGALLRAWARADLA